MKLKEFEGKSLLKSVGINVPSSILLERDNLQEVDLSNKIIRSQIFSNSRAKKGAIKVSNSQSEGEDIVRELFSSSFNEEAVEEVLIEDIINFNQEYYIAFLFDSIKKTLF